MIKFNGVLLLFKYIGHENFVFFFQWFEIICPLQLQKQPKTTQMYATQLYFFGLKEI